jgi:hypothetical protein
MSTRKPSLVVRNTYPPKVLLGGGCGKRDDRAQIAAAQGRKVGLGAHLHLARPRTGLRIRAGRIMLLEMDRAVGLGSHLNFGSWRSSGYLIELLFLSLCGGEPVDHTSNG